MLSSVKIKSLKPKGIPYRVADVGGSCKGLGVNISAKGHKSFVLSMRLQQERKFFKIGDVANTSLSDARQAGLRLRKQIEQGITPRIDEPEVGTFKDLLDGYINYLTGKGTKTVSEVERVFSREIPEKIKSRAANAITPQIIADLIRPVAKRGSLTVATHMRAYLQAAFNWAIAADLDPLMDKNNNQFQISVNPVAPIPKPQKGSNTISRFLSEDEVAQFWNFLLEYSTPIPVAALRLLLATGQRTREVLSLRWDQIERVEGRYIWIMPTTKNGKPHEVPLNAVATEVLDWLRPITGDCQAAFPKRHSKITPTDSTVLNNAPRDLRRTVKTLAIKNGIPKSDMDLLQNHALGSDVSSKHYVRYEYLPERTIIADKWGDILVAMLPKF
jgi:integrase